MRYVLGIALIVVGLATRISEAQNQPLKFEAATIKPDQQGRRPNVGVMGGSCHGADKQYPPGGQFAPPPLGRCVLKRVNLNALIGIAYKVGVGVSGGPGWASADYFDVEGKAEDSTATEAQLLVMLQNLLTDRFHLQTHREQREVQAFSLYVAKNGPKSMKKSVGDDPPMLRFWSRLQGDCSKCHNGIFCKFPTRYGGRRGYRQDWS